MTNTWQPVDTGTKSCPSSSCNSEGWVGTSLKLTQAVLLAGGRSVGIVAREHAPRLGGHWVLQTALQTPLTVGQFGAWRGGGPWFISRSDLPGKAPRSGGIWEAWSKDWMCKLSSTLLIHALCVTHVTADCIYVC
jgi:hypothetical protein